MTAEDIVRVVGGRRSGDARIEVTDVTHDSRASLITKSQESRRKRNSPASLMTNTVAQSNTFALAAIN